MKKKIDIENLKVYASAVGVVAAAAAIAVGIGLLMRYLVQVALQ